MIKSSFTPPTVDFDTVDYYVAKGRRERSRAFVELVRAIFSSPEPKGAKPVTLQRSKLQTNS